MSNMVVVSLMIAVVAAIGTLIGIIDMNRKPKRTQKEAK